MEKTKEEYKGIYKQRKKKEENLLLIRKRLEKNIKTTIKKFNLEIKSKQDALEKIIKSNTKEEWEQLEYDADKKIKDAEILKESRRLKTIEKNSRTPEFYEKRNEQRKINAKFNSHNLRQYNMENFIYNIPKKNAIEKMAISQKKRYEKKKSNLKTLSAKEWEYIKKHFNNCCAYCGKPQTQELAMEHFIPVLYDGEFTRYNIIPSCQHCNSSKGSINFFDWYKNYEFYSLERELKILKFLHYENGVQNIKIRISY